MDTAPRVKIATDAHGVNATGCEMDHLDGSSASLRFHGVVNEICGLGWGQLSTTELVDAAWAYYYFSVQFRESLEIALTLHPGDANLAHLAEEECDTANLSPWPGIAAPGERMNHDTFMQRCLGLQAIDPQRAALLDAAGQNYLAATRALDAEVRAMSIVSYEDGGLERVFIAMLSAPDWGTPALAAFRHFLSEHIRFDSDPDAGHGALSRHIRMDDRVVALWTGFRDLFVASVPGLLRRPLVADMELGSVSPA